MNDTTIPYLSADNKLLLTDKFATIILNYSTHVLKKDFFKKLLTTCYTVEGGNVQEKHILLRISDTESKIFDPSLFEATDFHYVVPFITAYVASLSEADLQAWYFSLLNEEYGQNLFNATDADLTEKQLGREIAYKLYEPKEAKLDQSLNNHLLGLIHELASELDTSQIDNEFLENSLEIIEKLA